jgi:mono/diheme cytochrome c family protein
MMLRKSLPALLAAAALTGCSNFPSKDTPIWVWPDMKKQNKYKPQAQSEFFADGRTSRRPVANTVALETYREDEGYSGGLNPDNTYVARNPEPLTRQTIERGQVKFNVYCQPCHDKTGSGRGIVAHKATWVPGNLHDDRVVNFVDGEIYHVISNGRRSMPAYRFQIAEKDRWAIVAYVRALQRAYRGTLADVPADLQSKVR